MCAIASNGNDPPSRKVGHAQLVLLRPSAETVHLGLSGTGHSLRKGGSLLVGGHPRSPPMSPADHTYCACQQPVTIVGASDTRINVRIR